MTEQIVSDARSAALAWQADSRNRVGEPAPTAEDLAKEAVQVLGSPGAATAAAILSTTGWPPVPVDDDLETRRTGGGLRRRPARWRGRPVTR